MRTARLFITFASLALAALPILALPLGPSSADTPDAPPTARPLQIQKRGGNADAPATRGRTAPGAAIAPAIPDLPVQTRGRTAAGAPLPDDLAHKQAIQDLVADRDFAALHLKFKPPTVEETWPPVSDALPIPAGRVARPQAMVREKPVPKAHAPEPIQHAEPPKFNAGLEASDFNPVGLLKDLKKFTPEK